MRENIAPNRLAILPDLTHYEMFMTSRVAETALPFLNGDSNAELGGRGSRGAVSVLLRTMPARWRAIQP